MQSILSALVERGVNLIAFLGLPEGGPSQVDLVAEDRDALRGVAEAAGVALSEPKRVFLIQGDYDRGPSALGA